MPGEIVNYSIASTLFLQLKKVTSQDSRSPPEHQSNALSTKLISAEQININDHWHETSNHGHNDSEYIMGQQSLTNKSTIREQDFKTNTLHEIHVAN